MLPHCPSSSVITICNKYFGRIAVTEHLDQWPLWPVRHPNQYLSTYFRILRILEQVRNSKLNSLRPLLKNKGNFYININCAPCHWWWWGRPKTETKSLARHFYYTKNTEKKRQQVSHTEIYFGNMWKFSALISCSSRTSYNAKNDAQDIIGVRKEKCYFLILS